MLHQLTGDTDMHAKQNVSDGMTIVNFTRAKVVNARPASGKESLAYAKGEALGATFAESDIEWQGALAMLRTPTERAMLRRGFIATYAPLRGVSDKAAGNRFDYLARKFAPAETSKRAKHTAERRGRKAKATAVVEKMSDKAVAARLVAILAYVSDASAKHRGDEEVLSILGDIARLANGTK